MILREISLVSFKNIASAELRFSPKINCFLGDNGMGKSNLLDALYFMSFCKSFTGAADSMLVQRDSGFAMLKCRYLRRGLDEEVSAAVQPGRPKSFKRGGKAYQRLTQHIGAFPLVLLSPADMSLVGGEPTERRRFIDQIISQRDAPYLDALVRYNHALEQRNRLLKQECADGSLFDALEAQLEIAGDYISARRIENIARLEEIFRPYYRAIAECDEQPGLRYTGKDYSAEGGLAEHLRASRARDAILRYTASGPHRDDIEFTLDGMPVRRSASQGQTKTFTSALRFAQYELLRESLGIKPLLLLDDIFDKLDAGRVRRIMAIVGGSDSFGQIFITDTNRKHLDEIVADIPATTTEDPYRLWHVEHGCFTPIDTTA